MQPPAPKSAGCGGRLVASVGGHPLPLLRSRQLRFRPPRCSTSAPGWNAPVRGGSILRPNTLRRSRPVVIPPRCRKCRANAGGTLRCWPIFAEAVRPASTPTAGCSDPGAGRVEALDANQVMTMLVAEKQPSGPGHDRGASWDSKTHKSSMAGAGTGRTWHTRAFETEHQAELFLPCQECERDDLAAFRCLALGNILGPLTLHWRTSQNWARWIASRSLSPRCQRSGPHQPGQRQNAVFANARFGVAGPECAPPFTWAPWWAVGTTLARSGTCHQRLLAAGKPQETRPHRCACGKHLTILNAMVKSGSTLGVHPT